MGAVQHLREPSRTGRVRHECDGNGEKSGRKRLRQADAGHFRRERSATGRRRQHQRTRLDLARVMRRRQRRHPAFHAFRQPDRTARGRRSDQRGRKRQKLPGVRARGQVHVRKIRRMVRKIPGDRLRPGQISRFRGRQGRRLFLEHVVRVQRTGRSGRAAEYERRRSAESAVRIR